VPSTEPPKGQRFSLIYLDRGKPVQDSPRMRHRIGALLEEYPHQVMHDLGQYVERRLGIEARYITPAFLKRADLRDVLDIVTVTHDFLSRKSLGTRGWTANVNIIFDEENVPYMVDDEGGVHFRVDEEFARAIAATIAVLKNTKYANFLDAFERGQASLSEVPPNGKAAIRYVFSAVEGLFRHMFPSAPRLTGQFIEQHLRPFVKKGLGKAGW
jgi:hypothetical protein